MEPQLSTAPPANNDDHPAAPPENPKGKTAKKREKEKQRKARRKAEKAAGKEAQEKTAAEAQEKEPAEAQEKEAVTTTPNLTEETTPPEEDKEDSEGGWSFVGTDYLGALQARTCWLRLWKGWYHANEGVALGSRDYYTIDRFWAAVGTPAWEVRLCRALEIVGMSREDWWRVSDERSYLNGLAHPQVPEQAMKAAMERHIANSNHSSDTKKALKLAAKIASDRD